MFPGTSSKFREKSCPSGRVVASVSDGHFFATMEPRKPKPAKRRRKRRVKEPMTEDLLNELLDAPDPAAFASKHKLACRSLPDYLQQLLDERGMKRPEVVRQAGINPTFGYQIFVGQRNPSRNKLLQLAFAMKLSLRETNRLLQAGGCNEPVLQESARRHHHLLHRPRRNAANRRRAALCLSRGHHHRIALRLRARSRGPVFCSSASASRCICYHHRYERIPPTTS